MNKEQLTALINYLASKPFTEVHTFIAPLIAQLQSMDAQKESKPE